MRGLTELAALRRSNQYHSRARCVFCIIFAVLLFLGATPAPAGVLEDGFAALDLGDFETAERLLRPLGEQGDPRAQSLLGLICAHGKKDREAALWYNMAAEQGFAPAQYSLGLMYDKGRGVAQDDAEASRWYRMAAEQGDVDAQTDLGIMCLHGRGVPKDDGEAARWFRKAAERGNARAQGALGLVYMQGRGVPRDFVQGYLWLNLAAAQGEETGIKGRDCGMADDAGSDRRSASSVPRLEAKEVKPGASRDAGPLLLAIIYFANPESLDSPPRRQQSRAQAVMK